MGHSPDSNSERRIVRREVARRGDQAEASPSLDADLHRLFAAHRERVVRLCRRLVADPARAEELAQEALAIAWQRLPRFDDRGAFGPWLFGIARNVCRNANRKHTDRLTDDGLLDPDSPEVSVLRAMQRHERHQLVTEAAEALAPVEQEAVHLRYVEGLGIAQIDAVLGLAGSGARAVLQRCRRKLRRALLQRLEALGHGTSWFRTEG